MSNIYIQEPPTNGKVLLHTSLGEIDVELWSKEAPKACRNFVQLCLEGYYDNTIFHRVVKGFIAQGGDPTGTGTGGQSIYGKPFKDELHQRLKFNRRGLVAMANAGPDDNNSQFFFTLDRADELNKKHTIFGKVTGNTIYNMIRFNDLEVDGSDRPLDPPTLKRAEILSNPFDDMELQGTKKASVADNSESAKMKSSSKATKNYKLLSFGEEAEVDEVEADSVAKAIKIKSSHDALNDPKLSSQPAVDEKELALRAKETAEAAASVRKKLSKDKMPVRSSEIADEDAELDVVSNEEKKRTQRKKALKAEQRQLKRELASKKLEDSPPLKTSKKDETVEPANDMMARIEEERKEFLRKQKDSQLLVKGGSRESEVLSVLSAFTKKLEAVEPSSNDSDPLDGGDDDENDGSWMSHVLKFDVDGDSGAKDANVRGDDWYDIYDPRNPLNKRRREESKKSAKEKR